MIPFFQIESIHIFGSEVQTFDLLMAIGLLVAYVVARRRAKSVGLDVDVISDAMVWMALGGFVGAHFVSVFFYHPDRLADPWVLLKLWSGLSSLGGLFGGIVAGAVFFRRLTVAVTLCRQPETL